VVNYTFPAFTLIQDVSKQLHGRNGVYTDMEQKMIVFSNEQKFADVLNKPVTLIGSLSE